MPRPKSPCGTYSAYQRHLRERTSVDAACRRAQKAHDAGRVRSAGRQCLEAVDFAPTPVLDPLVQRRLALRASYLERLRALRSAAEKDDLFGVIDVSVELDALLDEWCEAQDDVDHARGYPGLPEDLRSSLLAHRAAPADK